MESRTVDEVDPARIQAAEVAGSSNPAEEVTGAVRYAQRTDRAARDARRTERSVVAQGAVGGGEQAAGAAAVEGEG